MWPQTPELAAEAAEAGVPPQRGRGRGAQLQAEGGVGFDLGRED